MRQSPIIDGTAGRRVPSLSSHHACRFLFSPKTYTAQAVGSQRASPPHIGPSVGPPSSPPVNAWNARGLAASGEPEPRRCMSPLQEAVATTFAPDGTLACTSEGFRPREGQTQLALAIARTIDQGGELVAEAATRFAAIYSASATSASARRSGPQPVLMFVWPSRMK